MTPTLSFLDTVWPGGPPEGTALVLWSASTKQSSRHRSNQQAAARALKDGQEDDLYLCLGTTDPKISYRSRGTKSDVRYIPGLVADFDLAGPGRGKENLFEDRSEILHLIDQLPLQPTLLVDTGGGIHAWWLFREPLEVENVLEVEALTRGWAALIADLSDRAVDAVWDLTRVLRIPGTRNTKYDAEISVLRADGPRCDPGGFEPYAAPAGTPVEGGAVGDFEINPNAEPPAQKLAALLTYDSEFAATWARNRRWRDQSPSSYDMSLATRAAEHGWTDQEIVDLMISFRRVHNLAPKLRRDYFERTISKASAVRSDAQVKGMLEDLASELDAPPGVVTLTVQAAASSDGPAPARNPRGTLLEKLRSMTRLPVKRIYREAVEGLVCYSVELDDGSLEVIGDTKRLLAWPTWELLAFERAKEGAPESIKPKTWKEFMVLVKRSGLIEQTAPAERNRDAPGEGILDAIEYYLRQYYGSNGIQADDMTGRELSDVIQANRPYMRGGQLHVHLKHLQEWMRRERVTVPPATLATALARLGLTPTTVNPGYGVCRSYRAGTWRMEEVAS